MRREETLFREAALQARRENPCSAIVLWQPLTLRIGAALAVCVAAGVAALLAFGTYTRRDTLHGWLAPDRGLIAVPAPQTGTVIARLATQGQAVAAGETLFVVSSERVSSAQGATREGIGAQLEREQRTLQLQLERLRERQGVERDTLAGQHAALAAQIRSIEAMIAAQRERIALASAAADRYASVQAQGFVALEDAIARREAVLEHRARLSALEQELSAKRGEAAELLARSRTLDVRYATEAADVERSLLATQAQRIENEAQRQIAVLAPRAGVVSAVLAEEGQIVDGAVPLAFVVPAGAVLQAELYAPSRVVGFVAPGDDVLLRFPAYPYQKFGHHRGTVLAVSGSALVGAELPRRGGLHGAGDALYRVIVALDSQTVTAYGKRHALRADMAVEADVLQDRRKLYEWIFDPIYALTGKLH
jgi:membrane fusion protein